MPKPGKFVTTRETSREIWEGYVEPETVQFAPDKNVFKKGALKTASDPKKDIEEINVAKPDVNNDGIEDHFNLIETEDLFLIYLRRGVVTQKSLGSCNDGFKIERGQALEPGLGILAASINKTSANEGDSDFVITDVSWANGTLTILGQFVENNVSKQFEKNWKVTGVKERPSLSAGE